MEPTIAYQLYKTIRKFFDLIKILGITYIIYLIIDALADKELIKVGLIGDFFLNISGSITVSWSITILASIYAYFTRKLCKRKTKDMGKQNDYLTRKIWPNKISSDISEDGTTKMEDEE